MEKQFYAAKGKFLMFMLIVIAVGLFFAWLAVNMLLNENSSLFMVFFYSLLALLLFGCSIMLGRMVLDKAPLVSFSTAGMEVNGPGGPGFVPWDELEGIFPYEVQGNPFLGIIVKDEEKYIERLPSRKKRLVRINQRTGFPPFNLALISLKHKREFIEELEQREVPVLAVEEEMEKERLK